MIFIKKRSLAIAKLFIKKLDFKYKKKLGLAHIKAPSFSNNILQISGG
jgi:hypothetical protein